MKDKYFIPQSRASELVGQSKSSGDSDFTTATMTITGSVSINIGVPTVVDDIVEGSFLSSIIFTRYPGETYTVLLYKGHLLGEVIGSNIVVSGDAQLLDGNLISITGNFTIGIDNEETIY